MSKELEALKSIKGTIIFSRVISGAERAEHYYIGDLKSTKKYFDIIEEALKRNEPVKLLKEKGEKDYHWDEWWMLFGVCPSCNQDNPCFAKYCVECGQALERIE